MDVRCDKCQARYRIEDARVASAGPAGLSMRCGKCGNIFKITKDGAAAASSPGTSKPPPAAAPSAPPPADLPGSTMMFQAPKIPPPAAKPTPAAPAPSAPPPADLPGSTMMFQAPKIPPPAAKPAPAPAPAAAKPPGHTSDDDSGSTMMFGTAPIKLDAAPAAPAPAAPAPSAPPAKAAPKAPAPAADDGAGSTMMFGASPIAKPPPAAAAKAAPAAAKSGAGAPRPPPPAPAPAPAPKKVEPTTIPEPEKEEEEAPASPHEEETASGNEAPGAEPEAASEPVQARAGESVGEDDVDPSAMTGEVGDPSQEAVAPVPVEPRKPLPKAVIYGGIGAGALIVIAVIVFALITHFGPHPPPAAAVKMLSEARDLLDKDSLATFPKALEENAAAMAAAPKSPFPEAHALQAEIELAWSDALADDAQLLTDKSARLDDDKKKADADAAAQKATADSNVHIKTSFEAAKAGNTLMPTSPDVHLALADYYRAAKSYPNYEREIKRAVSFKANPGRLDAVEGSKLLADDDGADKGLAKLKAALAADPQSARIQYRIAQAYAILKNDAEEKKALDATLKLSPNHERAKLMLEAIAAAAAANAPPAPADQK